MAIVSIKEGYTGVEAGGSVSREGVKRTATRVYTVVTDATSRGLWTFPITDGTLIIPAAGTAHPDDGDLYSGVPIVVAKGPAYFEVRVPYETEYEDPLAAAAELSWDDAERQVQYDTDLDGTPVANTLGEPFDPPRTKPVSDPVLIIERNQAAFDPDDKLLFQDTVCAEVFYGAAIGRAKMGKIKARSVAAETPYWRVRYEITFRMKTPTGVPDAKAWWTQLLNQGVKYLDGDGNLQLSPNGELLLLAADGTKTTAAAPHWLYFRDYPDQSWAALGL